MRSHSSVLIEVARSLSEICGVAGRLAEGRLDVVGVGGLGEIMAGAELDRLHRGGDAGEAGQHDDQHGGIVRVQGLHAGEAGSAGELQVDDGVAGRALAQQRLQRIERGPSRTS